jgi:hypothetical protein
VPVSGNTPSIQAGPVGAFTDNASGSAFGSSPGAAAVVSVRGVTIPTSSGTVFIAGPIQAIAQYACANGKLTSSASSTLNLIYVNGAAHPLPTNKESTLNLGGGAYISTNIQTKTATSLTEQILRVHIPGLADIVLGEAVVSLSKSDPCAGTNGPPPPLEICPTGSTLEVAQQYCVIVYRGQTIIVSRPFKGPSGGTVYPLAVARKKTHSPCLFGPGPKFAVLAYKRGGRVEGTLLSDRIVAIGSFERVAGLGGNDCLDGKGTTERLFDGSGKDRVFAARGRNRIAVGNGNDRISGGRDGDRITTGNGNDTIYGNAGNDGIDAGLGHNHIFGGTGQNRIFEPGANAIVNCGPDPGNRAFLRAKAIPYASAHGCQRILHLM